MCGINVVFDSEANSEWINNMNAALAHRGPDASGIYQSSKASLYLGSQRLKIIDLNSGDMPYLSPCGRYSMVYNGELYNYPQLRSQLKDYPFKSQSDGEVLFAWLQVHGPEGLSKCNGMFSFAFWDEHTETLLMGRDRLGIKPLFYAQTQNTLYLSSEINALKTIPNISTELDQNALYHYLSLLSVPEPLSFYRGIKRFPKGHYAIYKNQKLEFQRYWNLSFQKREQSEKAWKKEIRNTFLESVQRRLVSDVPMGLLLSAGIDSNILAQCIRNEFNLKLHCYSLGFEGGEDESLLAQQTAEQLQLPFIKHKLKPEALLEHIPGIIEHFGEPFAGGLPIWFLCKHIHKDITVGLTGTGGDELFGNYGRPQHTSPHLGFFRGLKTFLKKPDFFNDHPNPIEGMEYLFAHGASLGHFYHEKVYPLKEHTKQALLKRQSNLRSDQWFESILWSEHHLDHKDRIFKLDLNTQLSEEFLYSQDILSMAHHMELRVPFLDHQMVELMASVPSHLRSSSHDPKKWMREVFAKDIPAHILNQPKRGFMIPYDEWMRHELKSQVETLLDRDFLHDQQIFEPTTLLNLWNEHQAGHDKTYALWSVLMFQIWYFQQQGQELKWLA